MFLVCMYIHTYIHVDETWSRWDSIRISRGPPCMSQKARREGELLRPNRLQVLDAPEIQVPWHPITRQKLFCFRIFFRQLPESGGSQRNAGFWSGAARILPYKPQLAATIHGLGTVSFDRNSKENKLILPPQMLADRSQPRTTGEVCVAASKLPRKGCELVKELPILSR